MIVLDTNVVSELVKSEPNPMVRRWFSLRSLDELSVTTITIFEIRFGLKLMQTSARRRRVEKLVSDILTTKVFGAVCSFGPAAAEFAAGARAMRRSIGREVGVADCMMAGIALEQRATLATRDVKDFDGVGLSLVDPWETSS